MAITWKQIDENGNGYVDRTEAQKAKEKGVKNVWNNMSQSDYENGITVDQKYESIKNETVNIARKYKYLLVFFLKKYEIRKYFHFCLYI